MPSTMDKVAVANLALDHLVERPLTSLADDTAYGRWMLRNLDHMRDVFLTLHPWNFSIVYAEVSEDATPPAFRFDHRYALPSTALRLLPLRYLGDLGGTPVAHEVVGGYIHCNVSSTLQIRYINQVVDYTTWDPAAVDAFALYLAFRMTMRFEAKVTWRDRLLKEYEQAIRVAMTLDAIQSDDEVVEQHTVLDVRMV